MFSWRRSGENERWSLKACLLGMKRGSTTLWADCCNISFLGAVWRSSSRPALSISHLSSFQTESMLIIVSRISPPTLLSQIPPLHLPPSAARRSWTEVIRILSSNLLQSTLAEVDRSRPRCYPRGLGIRLLRRFRRATPVR